MQFKREHRIELPQSRYFELMFDSEFESRMNREAMHVQNFEVLARDVSGATWTMRNRVTPQDNMPGFLKKIIGGGFSYEEQFTHVKGSDRATVTMTPNVLREKLRMGYQLRIVPEGDHACLRIMEWDLEVKIFGVGGQIEKFAMGETDRGMDSSARYMSQHGKPAS